MPRTITVTFADGSSHVYQNAPDDVMPEAVEARALKEFGKPVANLGGGRPAPQQEQAIQPQDQSPIDDIKQGAKDLAGGLVRGAGSIGATIIAPYDIAKDALAGKGLSLESNRQRRADIDSGLTELVGSNPENLMYKGGKLAGEIAGTAGAGGVLAPGARVLGAAPGMVNAIRTAGFAGNASGVAGPVGNAITRAIGGGITGAASAGLVDPSDAGAGGAVGAALPGAMQVAGKASNAIGRIVNGPAQSADLTKAVQSARANGYVIPPTQASPTLANRILEGLSGKLTTAQNASAKNQGVTNGIAAKALGLPADAKITPDVLQTIRKTAGNAYSDIGATGSITPGADYGKALDAISAPFVKASQGFPNAKPSPVLELVESLRSPTFDAAAAVEKIKQLRTAADDAFRSGNTDIARASKSAAAALENAIDDHLQAIGSADLLQSFREARQLIAKSYSVEKAMNPTTGSIDARKLAAQLSRGKPLSGELREVAEFASRFPKAAQNVEGMGSLPQTSPLDWAGAGAISAATYNPLMMASVMTRPAARALILSPAVQNRLAQSGPNALQQLIASPEVAQLGYRSAPVAAADR